MRAIGLIVNPVAGMGGRVGLKGTDGADVVRQAVALGAKPVAPVRAARALERLDAWREELTIVAPARAMGADLARDRGFRTEVVDAGDRDETSAADTRAAAAELERHAVALVVFAGGDGTARDVVSILGTRLPVLGIPTGVKMQSGVFATTPVAAGDIVAAYLRDRNPRLRDAEVMDVDEDALRHGRVSSRLYALARVPDDRTRVQHPKAASRAGDAELDALCRQVAAETRGLTFFGPGTTTRQVLSYLGIEGTLLGVDAVDDGRLAGNDLNEAQILDVLGDRDARLVVGVVGGQGYLFGRGNQQLSPTVIRRIGLDNIEVVAAADKVVTLDPPTLRVDTGDRDLDRELSGFRRVRVGPTRTLVLNVSA